MSTPIRTILAVDHGRWAVECYRTNHHAERVVRGDVDPALLRSVDLVLGGPPCQPYSAAGKQAGANDERDGVPVFCACVEAWRPRVWVMEQVAPFALAAKFEEPRQAMLARMEDAGYRVQYRVLNAYQFGVPQFRKRAWFVGVRDDLGLPAFVWPEQTHERPDRIGLMPWRPWVTVREALGLHGAVCIGGCSNPRFPGDARTERDITDEPSKTIVASHLHKLPAIRRLRGASVDRPDHAIDEPSPTVTAVDGGSSGLAVVEIKQKRSALPIDGPAPTLCADSRHAYRWSDEMRAKHPPADPDAPSPAVLATWHKGGAVGLLSCGDAMVRRLTPDECARLQSVPDDWRWPEGMPKTAKYRVVGNGWACGMAARIGEAVCAMDPAIETAADLFCGGGLGAVGFAGRYWRRVEEAAR